MPAVSFSPIWNGQQFFDDNGDPLSGGKIFQYEAGSFSVQRTTYSDAAGTVANTNPIVLDSSGRINTELYLENGLAYNLVLTLPNGTTVKAYVDNVIGVQSTAGGNQLTTAIWTTVTQTPTYVNASTFLIPTNLTQEFAVGNRVQAESTPGVYVYGTVSAVAFSSPNTQVTMVMDSSPLPAGVTAVKWSVNVSTARTVDAAAVAYNVPAAYAATNTVGYQIKTLNTNVGAVTAQYAASQLVANATGTNTYAVTITPAITSYSVDQIFTIKFANANTGACTLNINGVGSAALVTIDSAGAEITPRITANQIATVAYNGTKFVMLTKNDLPGQATNSGKYLTTNGTTTSWASLGTPPTVLGSEGYTILPGNYMMQWGVTPPITYPGVGGGTLAIAFSTPFATCYGVQATRIGTENQSGNKRDDHAVTSVGPTGFTMFSNYENMSPQTYYWLAYGVAP